MATVDQADGTQGASLTNGSSLSTYYPEPSTTGIGVFRDVMNAVQSATGTLASNNLTSGNIGGVSLDATGSFSQLIQAQIQAQMEMQTTTLVSNLEQAKHETKMAAIRNIRMS